MLRLSAPATALVALAAFPALAQVKDGDELFRQLEDELATPTSTRNAAGAPGHEYWQQQVDYQIQVSLDEERHRITGRETITYTNKSPDVLRYLWVQLDQNTEAKDAEHFRIETTSPVPGEDGEKSFRELGYLLYRQNFEGGYKIASVTDGAGAPLDHRIVGTMLRVDLARPLGPGQQQVFSIAWSYNVRNISTFSTRTGYELLKNDPKNAIYTIAHWYPRLAAYSDRYGWHVHNYLGEEFALEFGDFDVSITVPADYQVGSTGELQNGAEILTPEQQQRLAAARTAKEPTFVVTPAEAREAERGRDTTTRTWRFQAQNVRDFAWAASRKYIWDAMGVKVGDRTVMCMSFYPNEAEPLWSRYSTHAVAHTLEGYGRYLPYPYPVALSCNGAVGGMEHPMISFQRARPELDGTYSPGQKYGLISVIIHEVGHNWFPMIINNPERRWRWMDEGFNSFVQQVTEGYWEDDYPSRNDSRRSRILSYMKSKTDQPIMTNTSLLIEGGNNAYSKTTLALTVLRESVLGREVFDYAFSEYCRRWAFKRPMPSDFFRTMEDASGQDLDWFFRGWFYGTDHVDLAVTSVKKFRVDTRDPEIEKPRARAEDAAKPLRPRQERNRAQPKRVDRFPELKDYYNEEHDRFEITLADREGFKKMMDGLEPYQRRLLKLEQMIYVVDFENVGGLAMPLPLPFHYAAGTQSQLKIEATIWRRSRNGKVSKLFLSTKPITHVVLDAGDELADVDLTNNTFPQRISEGTLRLTGGGGGGGKNPMQRKAAAKKKADAKLKAEREQAEKARREREARAAEEAAQKAAEGAGQ